MGRLVCNVGMLLRGHCIACVIGALATSFTYGDVSINFDIGPLRDVSGDPAAPDSLWAIVVAAPGSQLPGGLDQDSSLTQSDAPLAQADFGGATIAPGANIGDAIIMATGQIDADSLVLPETITWTNEDYQNIQQGALIGLYWFPGIVEKTTVLPKRGFAIGGMQETEPDVNSGGNAGMIVPANNGGTITIAYDDEETSSLSAERFTAIEIPQSGYQVWRDSTFTPSQIDAGDADPGADPDGDGLANLLEYATGSSPLVPSPSPLTLTRAGESVMLRFNRIADPELRYRIEATEDLTVSPWTDVVFESSGSGNVEELLELSVPLAPGRRFFRLRVEFVAE